MSTKRLIITALCIAVGIILPSVFHSIPNAGAIFLPMHIPVLLCGMLCGPKYGLACGAATPLISSIATGMPPSAALPGMLCELAVYGLISGILFKNIKTGHTIVNIYISLIGAMICGRITYGILNSFIFQAGSYSMETWLTSAFVISVPGIVIQLIIIPVIVMALKRAGVINMEKAGSTQ